MLGRSGPVDIQAVRDRTVHECWSEWTDVQPVAPAERVLRPLTGTAFFPGGYGVWDPPSDLGQLPSRTLRRDVMLVAHNFGSVDYHEECRRDGDREDTSDHSGTWSGLTKLLARAELDYKKCFLTNAFVGLLPKGTPLTGKLPGAGDLRFIVECARALSRQFEVVRPRVVITLGDPAKHVVAGTSSELRNRWRGPRSGRRSIKELDADGVAMVPQVEIAPQVFCSAVAICHPCYPSNGCKRSYRGHVGDAAEPAMVKAAMTAAGLT